MKAARAALALALALCAPARAGDTTIFAAASLTDALGAVIEAYEAQSGARVVAAYAASSVLARQIDAGAPAALFFSANAAWAEWLAARGRAAPEARWDILGNRLVLAAPPGAAVPPPLAEALAPGGPLADGWLALADPDHAPAGQYAREALETLGIWPFAAARAVRTGDVRAAVALLRRGEAALAVVYRTDLAACPECREIALLPEASHAPIVYPVVAVAENRTAAADAFLAFLLGAEAAGLFRTHGFLVREGPVGESSVPAAR